MVGVQGFILGVFGIKQLLDEVSQRSLVLLSKADKKSWGRLHSLNWIEPFYQYTYLIKCIVALLDFRQQEGTGTVKLLYISSKASKWQRHAVVWLRIIRLNMRKILGCVHLNKKSVFYTFLCDFFGIFCEDSCANLSKVKFDCAKTSTFRRSD